eukprot:COSAG06_NODE_5517_length_3429_cov_1.224324_2_plen_94_part_00
MKYAVQGRLDSDTMYLLLSFSNYLRSQLSSHSGARPVASGAGGCKGHAEVAGTAAWATLRYRRAARGRRVHIRSAAAVALVVPASMARITVTP